MTQELWFESFGHTKCICIDQHLSVCSVSGSYTNGDSFHLSTHLGSQRCWNFFQCHSKNTGFVKSLCISKQFLCLGLFFGTKAITTKLIDTLWGQAQMSLYRNTGINDTLDGINNFDASLHFYGIHSTLLDDADSIANTFFT